MHLQSQDTESCREKMQMFATMQED